LTLVGGCDTIRVEVMRMTYRQIRGFKTWLEDVAGTPEALEWARGLGEKELEALAEALEERGYPLDTEGKPVGADDNRFWDALNGALEELGL
jgi:hypothetical protein